MTRRADVMVAGGGPAGLAAAVAAARNGADTLLAERYGFLGGMATAGLVSPFMGNSISHQELVTGIYSEVVERLEAAGGYGGRTRTAFDAEIFKFVADDLCREAGVRLLLHAWVGQPTLKGSRITRVAVEDKSGTEHVAADVYVDATGDADLAARAGVPCEKGRGSDGLTQPMTLNVQVGDVDVEKMPDRGEINRHWDMAKGRGEVTNPRENVLLFFVPAPGVVHFNTTRVVQRDATDADDLTAAEIEGRRQARELLAFLRKHVRGFHHARIVAMGTQIGVRESRRIVGGYVMTRDDILRGRKFRDAVARGNYPIDIHSPTGAGTVIERPPEGDYYEIPFCCLVPQRIDNLLVAGRSISTTHEAQAAVRIMPICIALGQAAGTAAALCSQTQIKPRDLNAARLRRRLIQQGAYLRRRTGGE
jgi:glycine/D-amino acid oxidase-like deaminating enzyme